MLGCVVCYAGLCCDCDVLYLPSPLYRTCLSVLRCQLRAKVLYLYISSIHIVGHMTQSLKPTRPGYEIYIWSHDIILGRSSQFCVFSDVAHLLGHATRVCEFFDVCEELNHTSASSSPSTSSSSSSESKDDAKVVLCRSQCLSQDFFSCVSKTTRASVSRKQWSFSFW